MRRDACRKFFSVKCLFTHLFCHMARVRRRSSRGSPDAAAERHPTRQFPPDALAGLSWGGAAETRGEDDKEVTSGSAEMADKECFYFYPHTDGGSVLLQVLLLPLFWNFVTFPLFFVPCCCQISFSTHKCSETPASCWASRWTWTRRWTRQPWHFHLPL